MTDPTRSDDHHAPVPATAPGPAAPSLSPPAPPTPALPGTPASTAPPPPPPPTPAAGNRSGALPRLAAAILAVVLAVGLFSGGVLVGRSAATDGAGPTSSGSADAASELALIDQAWNLIQQHYVDAAHLDDQAMAYAAIDGMTQAVGDPGHTSFLTAAESKAMDQSLSGTFVGIGVQIDGSNPNAAVISSVIPNTPAQEAGLMRGDQIVAVDGTSTSGKTLDQVVTMVRGPEGQPVTLTIERGSTTLDVTIVRRKFDLPLVSWTMLPGHPIALIRLDEFATGATKAVKDAIAGARAAGATGVILDLRGNPGGYVTEAIGVASQFIGDGIVYRSIDAGGVEKTYPVEPGGAWTTGPLVVLTDGNTASSAEMVAGAIQDALRGSLVGEKTFGTGTVTISFGLADGSSLRIGVERYLTRSGRPIWHEGLEPDVAVALPSGATLLQPGDVKAMTATQLAASSDAQLLKAIQVISDGG